MNESLEDSADEWMNSANYSEGSWWRHWDQWLQGFNPEEQVAPFPQGNENYPAIDKAPGQYVKQVLPIIVEETATEAI